MIDPESTKGGDHAAEREGGDHGGRFPVTVRYADAQALAARGGNIPPRIIRTGSFAFSTWVYRQRNLVERFFNQVKQFRGLATRYDRNPENYLAALKLAAVRIWLARICWGHSHYRPHHR